MFAYNTSVNRNTGFTPYELLFVQTPNIPSKFYNRPSFTYGYEDYVGEMKAWLQENFRRARENLLKSKEKEKTRYDLRSKPVTIEVGDFVFLKNEQTIPGKSKKLLPIYLGPYKVISKDSSVNFVILVGEKEMKVHSNRFKKFN